MGVGSIFLRSKGFINLSKNGVRVSAASGAFQVMNITHVCFLSSLCSVEKKLFLGMADFPSFPGAQLFVGPLCVVTSGFLVCLFSGKRAHK